MPSAAEWRDALDAALEARRPRIKLYDDYYNGDHRLSFATSKFKEAFGELFGEFADNWCQLVVDVCVERLQVLGFRFGEDSADDEAWSIWQANNLDARMMQAWTEAVKKETAYLLVAPPLEPGGEPRISVETPDECVTAHDPADRRIRLAGLKKFRAVDGSIYAQVFFPDSIVTYRSLAFPALSAANFQMPFGVPGPTGSGQWEVVAEQANPLGEVPLIPLENTASLTLGGVSDLKPAVSLQDAANKFFTDMIHASEFVSFPQRVMTGVEIPRDPITGEPIDEAQIRAAVSRMWAFENPEAKVFQLQQGDLSNFVEGVDLAVQHLAAQTRTPPHYLLARLVNVAGEALVAAESGLVARCRRKHTDFSDGQEEAMRLAFKWRAIDRRGWAGAGDDLVRSSMDDAETIWADPEKKDPVSLSQSLTMKQQIGVPQEILWEEAGYTPQQIKRMTKLRDEELKRVKDEADAANIATAVGITDLGDKLAVSAPMLAPAPVQQPAPGGQQGGQQGGQPPKPKPAAK